jgi:hypothetical protein
VADMAVCCGLLVFESEKWKTANLGFGGDLTNRSKSDPIGRKEIDKVNDQE